jgi:3-hydroxyacyl-[acyl-carrier-protein] dehydratase
MSESQTSSGAGKTAAAPVLENSDLQHILPHRFPMLLIDRVIEIQPRERIVAVKNVTANEPFFAGHFPGFPIMPGVLIVEALAQAGGALLMQEYSDRTSIIMVFTGIEKARFRKPVVPGDQLRLEVSVLAWRATAARMQAYAYVGDKLVTEAVISCALVKRAPKDAAGQASPSVAS